jgi:uncharacterized protein YbaP (TraB family)
MKWFYLFLLSGVGLLLPHIGNAQENASALLWEISGKKVSSPSYIFGTMHLIPKKDFLFPSHLQDKVKSTEVLVMEIGGLSNQMKMMEHLFLKEGNVFDFFSQPQKDTLFQYLNENLEIDSTTAKMQFGRMKPMALIQLFTQQSFGESPESYEMTLEKIANENEMEIKGLESVEEQIAIFDQMSMEDQVEMIMAAIRSSEEDGGIEVLIEIYLQQDIEKLHAYMNQDSSGMMNYQDELLDNRNANWIPLIKKMIKKNSSFIAVGAGHLGGENGVIALLRAEGYTLKPIKL